MILKKNKVHKGARLYPKEVKKIQDLADKEYNGVWTEALRELIRCGWDWKKEKGENDG